MQCKYDALLKNATWELVPLLDVNDAFLNRDIKTEVYMLQPKRFINDEFTTHVFKLKKAIYGLK